MRKIDWKDISKFTPDEFSEDPDKYAEPELIYRLNFYRVKSKSKIKPSSIKGALARFDGGTSQHTIKDNKLSKAVDIFQEGIPFKNYSLLLSMGLFNGIGIYLDTAGPDGLPWIMFHVDIRNRGYGYGNPLIWIVEKVVDPSDPTKRINKYRYPQYESKYWKLFQDERLFIPKKYKIRRPSTVG